jgi:pimeloyl-ACP methyl ester carboxylesterase
LFAAGLLINGRFSDSGAALVQHVGMGQRNFRMIETNGITLRVVVEGQGPLLVLLHGFPQCWYLWRHQIDELVAAGYQVAVPDQRGYGGSDKPEEIEAYDGMHLVSDVVGIADALGHDTFTLIIHDIGAVIGWDIAMLYPERVNAVFALSVPPKRSGRTATRQEDIGDHFFYVVYFQQPGIAEAELDADVRKSLRMIHFALSGDAPPGLYLQPKRANAKLLDGLIDPDPLPNWLTDEDLDVYSEAYRDGFRGPINWYRNGRSAEVTRRLGNAAITQPCYFMAGSLDPALVLLRDAYDNLEQNVPDLRANVILDGAGHWLPLERTNEVNSALLDFLRGLER